MKAVQHGAPPVDVRWARRLGSRCMTSTSHPLPSRKTFFSAMWRVVASSSVRNLTANQSWKGILSVPMGLTETLCPEQRLLSRPRMAPMCISSRKC